MASIRGSEATLTEATEAALRTDTLIYSILFADAGFYHGPLFGRMSSEAEGTLSHA